MPANSTLEKTNEDQILKRIYDTGSIRYSVQIQHNRYRYSKSFMTMPEAITYRDNVKKKLIEGKTVQTNSKKITKKTKRTQVESNIFKEINKSNIKYYVYFTHKGKKYSKSFDTLEEARKYKIDKFKELGKKVIKIKGDKSVLTEKKIEKYISELTNINNKNISYRVNITINNKKYNKIFKSLEEAKTYKKDLIKNKDEEIRLKRIRKEKKKKIIPKKKEMFEKPKIYKRKPRTKKILGQYTLPTEDDELSQ